jgi:hypothetical protein
MGWYLGAYKDGFYGGTSSEMICEAAIDRIKEVIVLTASANKLAP